LVKNHGFEPTTPLFGAPVRGAPFGIFVEIFGMRKL